MKKNSLVFFLVIAFSLPEIALSQFVQQGPKLVGTGSIGFSQQGRQVAVSSDGNTAIVGGPVDNTLRGAVWVFVRNSGVWTQQGSKLVGTGGTISDFFGSSVALSSDGNTALIGADADSNHIGATFVFTRSAGVWTQQGPKLVGLGNTGNSYQGTAVSLSSDGNTALIGGPNDNNLTGAFWVFTRSGGVWTQESTKLVGSGYVGYADEGYALSLSGDGNTAIVGGQLDNNSMGAVWVFTRTGGVWSQVGSKLVGTGYSGPADQGFSIAISTDGNTFVSGGSNDANGKGAIWIFTKSAGVWSQQGPKLFGLGFAGTDPSEGYSVSITSDGSTVISGAPVDSNGLGAVWVFKRNNGVWSQLGSKLVGSGSQGTSSFQGTSVCMSSDGSTILSGANFDNSQTGATWVFFNPTIGVVPISSEIPGSFKLMQNYPNPFNPTTKIMFELPVSEIVTIKVFDVLGREVETVVKEELLAGEYEVNFDASSLASGIYFYSIITQDFVQTKKMILIK